MKSCSLRLDGPITESHQQLNAGNCSATVRVLGHGDGPIDVQKARVCHLVHNVFLSQFIRAGEGDFAVPGSRCLPPSY